MFNISSLPSSIAKAFDEKFLAESRYNFTFTGFIDIESLCADINVKLTMLETSKKMNKLGLEEVIQLTNQIQEKIGSKEEFLTRIGWLQRLYQAKELISFADTREKIKLLLNLISPVQTCPLKNQLQVEIASLEATLRDEPANNMGSTRMELLMQNSLEEVGDVFINLGRAGREYVITEVLKQEGERATTAHVQTLAAQLEQQVLTLIDVSDRTEMIAKLNQLPLPTFSSLHDIRKVRIADALIQEKGWTGLFSLKRRISELINAIDREERENYERENVIDLPDGKAAAYIDLRFISID